LRNDFLIAIVRSSALELSSCGNQVLVDDTLPVRLRVEVSTLRRGGFEMSLKFQITDV
jgi:hypothetical protein